MSKPSQTIRTPQDVSRHFGANTTDLDGKPLKLDALNEMLSRRLYKDTSCGAWGKIVEVTRATGKRPAKWAVLLEDVGSGVAVVSARPLHEKKVPLDRLPNAVRAYLCIGVRDLDGHVIEGTETFQELLEFFERDHQPHRVVGRAKAQVWVTCTIDVLRKERKVMTFCCGSICEGADAEAKASPVDLPCAPKDLDDAVSNVEDQVNQIWLDTHGCEDCNEDGQVGGHVDPECRTCGGDGVVL